jgi:hypothetical protein
MENLKKAIAEEELSVEQCRELEKALIEKRDRLEIVEGNFVELNETFCQSPITIHKGMRGTVVFIHKAETYKTAVVNFRIAPMIDFSVAGINIKKLDKVISL